jgi:hypothetical protein
MMMNHPTDDRLPDGPAPGGAWLEARIPAVFAAVLATWALIAAWKVFRQLVG